MTAFAAVPTTYSMPRIVELAGLDPTDQSLFWYEAGQLFVEVAQATLDSALTTYAGEHIAGYRAAAIEGLKDTVQRFLDADQKYIGVQRSSDSGQYAEYYARSITGQIKNFDVLGGEVTGADLNVAAWTGITDGALDVGFGAYNQLQLAEAIGVDLSTATSLTDVATLVTAALFESVADPVGDLLVTWDTVGHRFRITDSGEGNYGVGFGSDPADPPFTSLATKMKLREEDGATLVGTDIEAFFMYRDRIEYIRSLTDIISTATTDVAAETTEAGIDAVIAAIVLPTM